ncbi:exosome complex protein Rrp42 [Desulfurococcus amylolyticus]|uniref:Exosome complex component Rrp42 n=1 Tax=Desulfurococcus amylolyticus (strain DSM 18924 / JCM 16383 / VKM B-2413 / 1221n) TaxID=490899 RepID=B8D6B8_DESA1|nr:exosome complex protein Rrp42 [Desulfurococcus amylolyticus]ACL11649.1 Probable exosome complex exonuclease 2 [Desulfurococcus amylolyticus 1221n]
MSITPEKEPLLPRIQVENIVKSIKKGERIDGRGLTDYRPIEVILNPITKASGSSLVKLGGTQVIAGVKLELEEPFPDRPGEGVLQVHAEFVPLASPSFEPGPPDENAIEVARVIDRSLRESKAVKLDALAIEPGKIVWSVYTDIYLVDHQGNIIDTGMLASMLALATSRIPELIKGENGYKVDHTKYVGPLPINTLVATVTMGIYNDVIIVDPLLEEEAVIDSFITIAIDESGRICGIQKRGMKGFSRSVLDNTIEIALSKGRELVDLMKKILNNPSEYMKPLVSE